MKRTLSLFIACVLLALGLMVWGLGPAQEPRQAAEPAYALLLADDQSTDAMQLKHGAQTAAEEYGASLSIYAAGQEEPVEEQLIALLEDIRATDVAGLLLAASEAEALGRASALAAEKNIPLVYLGAESALASASVLSDYGEQGRLLAEAYGGLPPEAQGPVTVFLRDEPRERALLQGVRAGLRRDLTLVIEGAGSFAQAVAQLPENACVFALTPELTERVARSVGGSRMVLGVDPGESRVELLEKELVAGLVMDMPYAQGYMAVEALHRIGSGEKPAPALRSPSRLVTKDAMYTAENVKLMFPLLQ